MTDGEMMKVGVQEEGMLPLLPSQVVEEEVVVEEGEKDVSSVARMATCPGSVPQEGAEVEAITSAGTAGRRATWHLTALSLRCAGGAARRGTWWPSVQIQRPAGGAGRRGTWWPTALSRRNASTAVKKVTVPLNVLSPRSAGDARKRGTR